MNHSCNIVKPRIAGHFDGSVSQPRAPAGHRTCIVVLGMHRSGTSALTRVLNLLGAALPRHVMGASLSNPTGHWEPDKLVGYHEALLAELYSAWDDWRSLDLSRLTVQRRGVIRTRLAEILKDEYGDASLVVVKDPRICRFAPLFLEAVTEAGLTAECVLAVRNPLEVAQSLERRDGMSRGEVGLLWLRHVLDSEAGTRGRRREILFYGDLLADWEGEIGRIMSHAEPGRAHDGAAGAEAGARHVWPEIAKDISRRIDDFLSAEQRHHAHSSADLTGDPIMSGWIAEVYDALHQLRQRPGCPAALAILDKVRGEFDGASRKALQATTDESIIAEMDRLIRENVKLRHLWAQRERWRLAILASTSWRTVPVRLILGRLTPAQHQFVWQCFKAAWWLATPWRIPARLRFIRLQARRVSRAADAVGRRTLHRPRVPQER